MIKLIKAYDKNLKSVFGYYMAFKELSNDENRPKKEMNISFERRLIIYFKTIDNYVKASRELKALAEDGKEYDRMKQRAKTMGIGFASASHEKVLKTAESIISSSNSLN